MQKYLDGRRSGPARSRSSTPAWPTYREQLDEDGQVDVQGQGEGVPANAYGFLASILPYTNAEWEKLSIFLTFLVPKLPAPIEDDLSKGILEAIDMDSYRVEKQAVQDIQLPDEDAEIEPGPHRRWRTEAGHRSWTGSQTSSRSSTIGIRQISSGTIRDKIERVICGGAAGEGCRRSRRIRTPSPTPIKQNARIEHDKALERAMTELIADHTEFFKQFSDNESFRRWLSEMNFASTYLVPVTSASVPVDRVGQ